MLMYKNYTEFVRISTKKKTAAVKKILQIQ